jgi:hypothetical protein
LNTSQYFEKADAEIRGQHRRAWIKKNININIKNNNIGTKTK